MKGDGGRKLDGDIETNEKQNPKALNPITGTKTDPSST
jgi:hypothetical protein